MAVGRFVQVKGYGNAWQRQNITTKFHAQPCLASGASAGQMEVQAANEHAADWAWRAWLGAPAVRMPLSSLALGVAAPRRVRGGHSNGTWVAAESRRDAGAGAPEGHSGSSGMSAGERASCSERVTYLDQALASACQMLC